MNTSDSRKSHLLLALMYVPIVGVPLVYSLVSLVAGDSVSEQWNDGFLRSLISFIVLFSVNVLMLRFIFRRGHTVGYVMALVVLMAAFVGFSFYNEAVHDPGPGTVSAMRIFHGGPRPALLDAFIGFLIICASLSVNIVYNYMRERRRNSDLEKEHYRRELEYLKAQINPHFAMNMLHNVHTLVEIDPARAQKMIVELSKLLRYVLYEGDKPLVPLSTEVGFLQTFLTLMSMRYSPSRVSVSFTFPERMPAVSVPPLLFIVPVENAFKHGVSYRTHSKLRFHLSCHEGCVSLTSTNTLHPQAPDAVPGIGLRNMVSRLNLLFPDRYTYTVDTTADTYTATLIIPYDETPEMRGN